MVLVHTIARREVHESIDRPGHHTLPLILRVVTDGPGSEDKGKREMRITRNWYYIVSPSHLCARELLTISGEKYNSRYSEHKLNSLSKFENK